MSRWTFSSVTFTKPPSDTDTNENDPENANGAMSVSAVTAGAVYPGEPYEFKVLYYIPKPGVYFEVHIPPGSAAYLMSAGTAYTESWTETVRLQYGEGRTSFPDWQGNTYVYRSAKAIYPLSYVEVTYTRRYRIVQLSASAAGSYEAVFMFSDGSNMNVVSFHVEPQAECDADHLELCIDQATCEEAGLYWYDGACHLEPQALTKDVEVHVTSFQEGSDIDGVTIELDGVVQGVTDTAGRLVLAGLNIGQTYNVRAYKAGSNFKPSYEDDLANETFTVS